MSESRCPDCNAAVGETHMDGCDVERCPVCGAQALLCGFCGDEEVSRLPWAGEWPGHAECIEFGWYTSDGYPDLNRLGREGVWDRAAGRFILSASGTPAAPETGDFSEPFSETPE